MGLRGSEMKYYEMDDRYRWWLHPLTIRNLNKQDCRIRWKKQYHDSLYSDDKMEW